MINPEELKVGDQYVNRGPNGCYIGKVRTVTKITGRRIYYSVDNYSSSSKFNDDCDFTTCFNFEKVMSLKDQYLKQGNLVRTADGDYGFVYSDKTILFRKENMSIKSIEEDLGNCAYNCVIEEVYKPLCISKGENLWNPEYYTSIWKRTVEKTVAELERELHIPSGTLRIKK